MGTGTPIWPIEGVELDSTGDIVADSLGQRMIDAEAAIAAVQGDITSIESKIDLIDAETDKIDQAVVDGLAGVEDSLAYKVAEIEHHLHSRERWWGAVAVPDETNAIEANVTRPFAATSGNDDWGAAIPILGTADDPTDGLGVKFDLHLLLITDLDSETDPWRLRIIVGTGTSADAISAGDWSEVMVEANAVPGNRAGGTPLIVQNVRADVGIKCWAQSWNDTTGEILSFFYGVHGYAG